MQYQTFRGADMKEALSRVKASLGADAVIESTRHVSNGKAGGLQRNFVEVTAGNPFAEEQKGPFSSDIRNARVATPAPASGLNSSRVSRVHSRRHDTGADHANGPAAPARMPVPSTIELDQELRNLRAMVEELRATRKPKERALALLHEAGFEGAIARELATGSHRSARQGSSFLREWLCSRISDRLATAPGLITRPGRQLIACIGPSGAGKTTTLAKLAARAKLEHGRSVGILSLDTYRVGAIEQWQRYAQLLGVPFAIARSVEEFDATAKSSMCDLLLVDTAGRASGDPNATWLLPQCLREVTRHQVHSLLVLPAWLRARDAEQVAAVYADTPPSGAIITKVDETMRRGGALQATIANALPLAYVCDGPRVPEDIRDANPDTMLRGLLTEDA